MSPWLDELQTQGPTEQLRARAQYCSVSKCAASKQLNNARRLTMVVAAVPPTMH